MRTNSSATKIATSANVNLKEGAKKMVVEKIRQSKKLNNLPAEIVEGSVTARIIADEIFKSGGAISKTSERVGIGIMLLSKHYDILWANQVIKDKFGDVEWQPCNEVLFNRRKRCEYCPIHNFLLSHNPPKPDRIILNTRHGANEHFERNIMPVKNNVGKIVSMVELLIPIKNARHAEKELESLREIFNSMLDYLSECFFVIDREYRLIYMDNACANICTGTKSPLSITGKKISDALPGYLTTVKALKEYEEVFIHGVPLLSTETLEIDGRKVLAKIRKHPITDQGQTVEVITLVTYD